MSEEALGMELVEAKNLKKKCEEEINKIINSFQERTRCYIESVVIDEHGPSLSRVKLNVNL